MGSRVGGGWGRGRTGRPRCTFFGGTLGRLFLFLFLCLLLLLARRARALVLPLLHGVVKAKAEGVLAAVVVVVLDPEASKVFLAVRAACAAAGTYGVRGRRRGVSIRPAGLPGRGLCRFAAGAWGAPRASTPQPPTNPPQKRWCGARHRGARKCAAKVDGRAKGREGPGTPDPPREEGARDCRPENERVPGRHHSSWSPRSYYYCAVCVAGVATACRRPPDKSGEGTLLAGNAWRGRDVEQHTHVAAAPAFPFFGVVFFFFFFFFFLPCCVPMEPAAAVGTATGSATEACAPPSPRKSAETCRIGASQSRPWSETALNRRLHRAAVVQPGFRPRSLGACARVEHARTLHPPPS